MSIQRETAPALRAEFSECHGSADVAPTPRILVVDDVADNRDILTRRLVRRGFEVTEAVGGEDALEKIAEQTFDLILLDIMMPDLSGNEVLRRIRQNHSGSQLPVIMVTAKSQSEDVVESLNCGANDYITKPVDFSVAIARINSQIEQKRLADQTSLVKESLEQKTQILDDTLQETSRELQKEAEKRQVTEERLRFLAYHDSLTGLLNRQGFRDALNHAVEEMRSSALEPTLLFIDLDAFKAVNDRHGHEIGDKLLCQVAERLVEAVGDRNLIARLGGDEFAIITRFATQPGPSMDLAARIVSKLTNPFFVDGKPLQIGASCGVARASQFAPDLDGLVKAADLAMYHAKAKHECSVVLFETRMLEELEARRELEIDLRNAVQQSHFEVYYQPLFDIRTRKITAFEALLRWPHETRGMIPPEVFIPLAEEVGLINQIGNWVLRQACEQAIQWPEHINVAVNISPLQFESPSLLPTLLNVLATTGINPNRLELEITESALLGAEGDNVKTLEAIRDLGIRISMDDFGTGYSSLTYLKDFRFDKIKIDRRFVQGLEVNSSDAAIVQAVIKLSGSIGIGTTAEGIETEAQYASVAEQGCQEGQGYLFSRPLTASDATEFIEKHLTEDTPGDDA